MCRRVSVLHDSNLALPKIAEEWWWLTSWCQPAAWWCHQWRFCCCPGDREEKTSRPCPGFPGRLWTPAWKHVTRDYKKYSPLFERCCSYKSEWIIFNHHIMLISSNAFVWSRSKDEDKKILLQGNILTHELFVSYLAAQANGILYWPKRWHVCLAALSTFWAVCGDTAANNQRTQH